MRPFWVRVGRFFEGLQVRQVDSTGGVEDSNTMTEQKPRSHRIVGLLEEDRKDMQRCLYLRSLQGILQSQCLIPMASIAGGGIGWKGLL